MAGLIGRHCPWRLSPIAEGSHGNSGAGQGSLQSQSTTAWAAQQLTGKGVTAREKQAPEGPEQALPHGAGRRHSCASWNPCAGMLPLCPSISQCKDHLYVLLPCTPGRLCDCSRGHWIFSHTSNAVHGASSVPPCPLALAVRRGAECEVVTEQEQGVKPLEPLQRLRQQRDSDCSSCVGEVCHQLLEPRNPS